MATSYRTTPFQIQTDASLPQALEACWYALAECGASDAVIDTQKNVVVGSTRKTMGSRGQRLTARLEAVGETTMIRLSSEALQMGTIDFGASRRRAIPWGDAIENALQANRWSANAGLPGGSPVELTKPLAPPIAAPTGLPRPEPAAIPTGGPQYGVAEPIKRGVGIFIYGLLGVTCCNIAAPFATIYGARALTEYKRAGRDPGDRVLIILGMVLGVLGSLRLLYLISVLVQLSLYGAR